MRGNLTVICGPMYGGKTTELLKRILWAKSLNKNVLVLKPEMENRYADDRIVSHDGLSADCIPVSSFDEWEELAEEADAIFLDEIQFFSHPHYRFGAIHEEIDALLEKGKEVIVNGLDLDARGYAFDATATLMAMADDVIKTKSICSICGQPATKTFKATQSQSRIELGSTGVYEPRCNKHWTRDGNQ